jgi:hypothetical protein
MKIRRRTARILFTVLKVYRNMRSVNASTGCPAFGVFGETAAEPGAHFVALLVRKRPELLGAWGFSFPLGS